MANLISTKRGATPIIPSISIRIIFLLDSNI